MSQPDWVARFINRIRDKAGFKTIWAETIARIAEGGDLIGDFPQRYPAAPEMAADELMDVWEKEGLHLEPWRSAAAIAAKSGPDRLAVTLDVRPDRTSSSTQLRLQSEEWFGRYSSKLHELVPAQDFIWREDLLGKWLQHSSATALKELVPNPEEAAELAMMWELEDMDVLGGYGPGRRFDCPQ